MRTGIFISEEDLQVAVKKYRADLTAYSASELSRGVTVLHFMGDPNSREHLIQPHSRCMQS